MYMTLDDATKGLLCCPYCHSALVSSVRGYGCQTCGLLFPQLAIQTGAGEEPVHDFRLRKPIFARTESEKEWEEAQEHYIEYLKEYDAKETFEGYLEEIERVREIYTQEFAISGKVLDVGGERGRLRRFLDSGTTQYVVTDPLESAFENIQTLPDFLAAYPQAKTSCNFIVADAERLPLAANSFDWVHMRSCLDHFYDPYLALLEAFRCVKPGGKLMIGLTIIEKYMELARLEACNALSLQQKGVKQTIKAMLGEERVAWLRKKRDGLLGKTAVAEEDDHMFRFSHDNLLSLCEGIGWKLEKEHWQKPPYDYCLYASFVADKKRG